MIEENDAGKPDRARHRAAESRRHRRRFPAIHAALAASLAASAAVAGSFGAAGIAAASAKTSTHAKAQVAMPHATGKLQTMIVFLRGGGSSLRTREASAKSLQTPVITELRSAGAHVLATTSFIETVIANMTAAQAGALRTDPAVARVIPSTSVPLPSMTAGRESLPASRHATAKVNTTAPCGTAAKPESDPEALGNINYAGAAAMKIDGAGVNVGFMAGGIDPSNADLLRNAAYASAGSPKGSKVITKYVDFGGDGTNAPSGDGGSEAWGDASTIAAQGNVKYDLSKFVNTAHPLPSGCDITITGDAPGANLFALEIFATNNLSTTSGFLQAINYGVENGVKVLSQSFGGNPFPDLSLDVVRKADEVAVADGVTVVVSSGDAGITGTQGSPSTDPAVIGVGATTTFRAYAQETFGGINAPVWKGTWVDNNISSLSSAGFTQRGSTVDISAPGDLGWSLCGASSKFPLCTNENGAASPIQDFGGTSQACPFVSGAAADVIEAYRNTHKGQWPTPALVKQILLSSATDINAPANEQGAGLLNIGAAVKLAESIAPTSAKRPPGGVLSTPSEINFEGTPGSAQSRAIKVTNTGSKPETVSLSTRKIASKPATTTGLKTFCLNPSGSDLPNCPAQKTTFKIWSGATEVYQAETFTVAAGAARLALSADYQYTGQSSLLHFGLFSPSGAFSAYSLPQGLGDYGEVEVANPPAGTWTAVFFTVQDGPGGTGTSGTIQWEATTWKYVSGASISPVTLSLGAGKSGTATLKMNGPTAAGDSAQSVVIKSAGGTNTIPVTMRTEVGISTGGGKFTGVLTGGNGRGGSPGQSNTFDFTVPTGKPSLDVTIKLTTVPVLPPALLLGDQLTAYLVDPSGQTVAYSSNMTTDSKGNPEAVDFVSIYHANPIAGQWRVLLQWPNPVAGNELSAPFSGTISFTALHLTSDTVPNSSSTTVSAKSGGTFAINICNPSSAPQQFFVDARTPAMTEYPLANVFGTTTPEVLGSISIPNAETAYIIPPDTTQFAANIAGTMPVTFDASYLPGDPDLSPALAEPGVSGSQSGDAASLTYSNPEVTPGMWALVPDEIGPYGTTGYQAGQAQVNFSVFTRAFDATVSASTGDMWENVTLDTQSATETPLYLTPAGSGSTNCGNISVTIKPTAAVNTVVSGTLYVDDSTIGSGFGTTVPAQSGILPMGDQMLAIPYKYKVST